MAGLTVLLTSAAESNPQILCKAKNLRLSRAPRPRSSPRAFLDQCFLCGRHLSHEEDIYMYRGDRAFCSDDCRWRQMAMDEDAAGGEPRTCSGSRERAAGSCVTARGGFAY